MPITKELENIRKFESVGFSHEQAETLTDVIEQSPFVSDFERFPCRTLAVL